MSNIVIPENFGYEPTEEQIKIIKCAIESDRLKIEAKAGSSKSTTLMLVSYNIVKPSLYLAFNKNMANEASRMFPDHVEVRTTHSLAYKKIGYKYQGKLERPRGEYKNVLGTGAEIARHFRIAPFVVTKEKSISATALGWAVKQTVTRFEHSGDEEIKEYHVSINEAGALRIMKEFNEREYRTRVLRYAKKLWEKRIDLNDDTLCTHDTYMKLYQLSHPQLDDWEVIYVDEFQDTNPCLLDIILNQKGKKIIAVGDTLQSIYMWRGAVNALSKVNWKEATLSKSFRFGPSVADIARGIVLDEDMKPYIHIEGFEKRHTEVVDTLPSNISRGIVHIFRTNAGLLEKALELIEEGKRIGIYVDVKDFISKIESVAALACGDKKGVKHQEIVAFNTWQEIQEEAKLSMGELGRIVKMVSSGQHFKILKLLKEYKPVKDPDIELITAHKSKGLTFSTVVLGNDFESAVPSEQTGKLQYVNEQEMHLLYVSLTRAQDVLVINSLVIDILKINNLWSVQNEDEMYFYEDEPNVKLNVNSITVISPGSGKEFVDNLKEENEKDLLNIMLDDEHVDERIDTHFEDGGNNNQLPVDILLCPDIERRINELQVG